MSRVCKAASWTKGTRRPSAQSPGGRPKSGGFENASSVSGSASLGGRRAERAGEQEDECPPHRRGRHGIWRPRGVQRRPCSNPPPGQARCRRRLHAATLFGVANLLTGPRRAPHRTVSAPDRRGRAVRSLRSGSHRSSRDDPGGHVQGGRLHHGPRREVAQRRARRAVRTECPRVRRIRRVLRRMVRLLRLAPPDQLHGPQGRRHLPDGRPDPSRVRLPGSASRRSILSDAHVQRATLPVPGPRAAGRALPRARATIGLSRPPTR